MFEEAVLCELFSMAPGPESAAACFVPDVWEAFGERPEPKLVGTQARKAFVINRTPATEAKARVAAIADPDYLCEIAQRDTRAGALEAVLTNPLVPLEAVVAMRTRVVDGTVPPLSWQIHASALVAAALRHAAQHGPAATVVHAQSLRVISDHEVGLVVAALPATRHDARFAAALLSRDPTLLDIFCRGDLGDVDIDVLRVLAVGPWRFAERLAQDRGLCDRHPALVDALFDRWWCARAPESLAVAAALARMPLDVERLTALAEWAKEACSPEVAAALAKNEACPSRLLLQQRVSGSSWHRTPPAGRLVAERFGDDPQAFVLCAELLCSFAGTYEQLLDVLQATCA